MGQHTGKEKFDAGLRLGTKMRLVEALGEIAGLGPAVGLLMGYESVSYTHLTLPTIYSV